MTATLRLTVSFYRTQAGNEPVREWLKQLSKDRKKAIGEDIKTVQLGWPLGMPLVRKLDPDLWEVRTMLADAWARVLFTTVGAEMVLLHGFLKDSRKIPKRELHIAQRRLKETLGKGHGKK